MFVLVGLVATLVLVAGCERADPVRGAPDALSASSRFHRALSARSGQDRERDAHRRPDRILELAGLREGMVVADLMAGAGWYTEVLARAVGSAGRVLAQNSALSDSRYGSSLRERVVQPELRNVELRVEELGELRLQPASLDAVFLVQFYHDTYWMGVDRDAMNRAVFDALKPGGVFLVIDHSAEPGSGDRDVETLHRVDEALVGSEIRAAGFTLDAESDLLRNEADERDRKVFAGPIRGRTDRFVLKFVK
jgi:predicted methyltransferase